MAHFINVNHGERTPFTFVMTWIPSCFCFPSAKYFGHERGTSTDESSFSRGPNIPQRDTFPLFGIQLGLSHSLTHFTYGAKPKIYTQVSTIFFADTPLTFTLILHIQSLPNRNCNSQPKNSEHTHNR